MWILQKAEQLLAPQQMVKVKVKLYLWLPRTLTWVVEV